jgi:hypothetical protein
MTDHISFANLSDDQLLTEVKRLASAERRATAALVRSLMEVDARRLYLREGCSSLFTYCTQVLHLEEAAAYNRKSHNAYEASLFFGLNGADCVREEAVVYSRSHSYW